MKTFIFVFVAVITVMALLLFLNWPTFMFMIPLIVAVILVVWSGLEYTSQMEEFAEEVNEEQEFMIIEKDGLPYVVLRSK